MLSFSAGWVPPLLKTFQVSNKASTRPAGLPYIFSFLFAGWRPIINYKKQEVFMRKEDIVRKYSILITHCLHHRRRRIIRFISSLIRRGRFISGVRGSRLRKDGEKGGIITIVREFLRL